MFPIRNSQIKEFCKDVSDVDYIEYISGWRSIKHKIDSERQYIELKELLSFNDEAAKAGKDPYVQILTDNSGLRYARLSNDCSEYAFNNDYSFIAECKERDRRNVPLRNAFYRFVDDSLEDRICEKCGNVLGLDCTKEEFQKNINNAINKKNYTVSKKIDGSKTYHEQFNPWNNTFLKFKDIEGGYLN